MTDRLPPCGHSNGTHPSGCWYVAVCDAVAAERARIRAAVEGLFDSPAVYPGSMAAMIRAENDLVRAVLRIVEGREP